VDVRIIAATNQDLAAAISRGEFRQDLYYRLNVYPMTLPPLREHPEDILLLIEHFSGKFAAEMGKNPIAFTPEALQTLRAYFWPGNVRELENCVERLFIVAPGGEVSPESLAASFAAGDTQGCRESAAVAGRPVFPLDLARRLEDMERELIVQALEEAGGVQVKAAELLHISERSIWHRIKKLKIAILNKKECM
jgi:two-component system NtrC family response regulator